MSELKGGLQSMFDALKELEGRARKLQNQNLADIAASAHGKIKQLHDHADLELVEEKPAESEQLPFDPNAGGVAAVGRPPRPLGTDEYPRTGGA